MTDNKATVEVTATDLRIGDVIREANGRYYAVDSTPERGLERNEYAEPHVTFLATEVHADRTPVASSEERARAVHAEDAVLEVLTPRPEQR